MKHLVKLGKNVASCASERVATLLKKRRAPVVLENRLTLALVAGNIRVLCRVRPPIREDGTGSQADVVVSYDPDDDGLIYVSNKGRIQTFEFDKVFSASSSQVQVKKNEKNFGGSF